MILKLPTLRTMTSHLAMIFILLFVLGKAKCVNTSGYDPRFGARMGGGSPLPKDFYIQMANGNNNDTILSVSGAPNYDTTKPQVKEKPPIRYTLSGSDTLFQVLWLQINSPTDVTPRNLEVLKNWVQRSLRQDTTKLIPNGN